MPEATLQPFLELDRISFSKNNTINFEDISWKINEGESWAVIGGAGSGKTTLMEALSGNFFIREGKIIYHFVEQSSASFAPLSDFIAFVSFAENSASFSYSKFYYQQRYNATEADNSLIVREYLNISQSSTYDKGNILNLLDIEELLDQGFIKLSNGQTRKVRLAKALLKNPKLLILDDPFVGLDVKSRENLNNIINNLAKSGKRIILVTKEDQLPECITNIVEIENFKIKRTCTLEEFKRLHQNASQIVYSTDLNQKLLKTVRRHDETSELIVQLKDVTIRYGEKTVLHEINWTIRKGEKWALLGPNGAGKSTLLSLITADNPQAYSQNIILFDISRGSGESIWDIKKKVGLLSPELHLYFNQLMTCMEVAATGFLDTMIINRRISQEEMDSLDSFFKYFGIEHLTNHSFRQISTGHQRLILFIRAIIKNPSLLILDEPFQGMDAALIKQCTTFLNNYSDPSQTIIFVTHLIDEIPGFIDNFLHLNAGKIVSEELKE